MKKWSIVIAVLVMIVTIVGGVFYVYSKPQKSPLSQSEKEESLSKLLGRKVELEKEEEVSGNTIYEGKYAQFSYPRKAEVYDYKDPNFASNSALLESFSYDLYSPRVVFNYSAYKKNSSFQFDDDSSIRLRRLPSRGYSEEGVSVGGAMGLMFSKEEGQNSEVSSFFLKDSILYSFSISGSDIEELKQIFGLVRGSVVFTP